MLDSGPATQVVVPQNPSALKFIDFFAGFEDGRGMEAKDALITD
jgi:hypothetical protein